MYQKESWKPYGLVLDDPASGPVRGWTERIEREHDLVAAYLDVKPHMRAGFLDGDLSYFDVLGAAERWVRDGKAERSVRKRSTVVGEAPS